MKRERYDRIVECHHLDGEPKDGIIYLWGDDNDGHGPFAALFKCPCGCTTDISIVVQPGTCQPRWDMARHENGTITLSPSIQQLGGCRSHFNIEQNRVVWYQ